MSESSGSSPGRAKSNRQIGRRQTLARRLRIEAMEGRVLLSGNTLDLSTFGNDLAPASYQISSTAVSGQNNSVTNVQINLPTPSGDSLGSSAISLPITTIGGEVQVLSDSTVVLPTFDGQYFSFLVSPNMPSSQSRYMLSADGHLVTRTTGLVPLGALNSERDLDYMRYNTLAPTAIDDAQAQVDYLDTTGATDLSAQSALSSHKNVVAGTIAGNRSIVTFVLPGEGGLTLTAPIGVGGASVGATSDLLNASCVGAVGGWALDTTGYAGNDALGSVAGTPRISGSTGGSNVSFDLGLVGDGTHVPTHPDLTHAVANTGQLFSESGSAWQAVRINAESGANVALEAPKGSVDSEGGLIQLASLARLSTGQLSANSEADADGHELDSSHEAGDMHADSAPLECEWDRAIAMESIGTTGLSRSADEQNSREASPDQASRADGRGPLSTDDSKARLESQSESGENASADIVQVGRVTSAALAAEGAENAGAVTSVVYVGSPHAGDLSSMLAHARRLDRSLRASQVAKANDGCDSRLVREEAFSDWHNGTVADANAVASQPSEYRLRVNPGPFLAILALERLAALDPRDDRRKRDAVGTLARDDGCE
ncbi:MAG TPA: hypothetical protein VGM76_00595 [Lacipirellulaceae bacterium]